jgi:CubicO group peptidase (beta-lactamase class C family)
MKSKNAIEIAIRELVEAGKLAGAATLAKMAGRHTAAVRRRDSNSPVERDTIFRIASILNR